MLKCLHSSIATAVVASSVMLSSAVTHAAQIATDPGDYSPLPAGVDLGILYYQSTSHEKFYSNGQEISDLAGIEELKTDIGLLRYVHYVDVGGYIVDPQIILPFGKVKLDTVGGSVTSSGIGDPIVGGTLWAYNNPETKQALGLTALLSMPLGKYEAAKGPVNIGENRWKLITQAAYVTPITDSVTFELIGEYTIFGENDDFAGLKKDQEDQYGVQTHLSKNFGPSTKATFSYYHDFGGETSLNGVDQNDELDNNHWQLTLQHFIRPDVQLQFEYGRSIDIENGFYENDRFNFRIVKVL